MAYYLSGYPSSGVFLPPGILANGEAIPPYYISDLFDEVNRMGKAVGYYPGEAINGGKIYWSTDGRAGIGTTSLSNTSFSGIFNLSSSTGADSLISMSGNLNSQAAIFYIAALPTGVNDGKIVSSRALGEPQGRLQIQTDGSIGVGGGTLGRDTFIYRSSSGTFKIDGNKLGSLPANLIVVGSISGNGLFISGVPVIASATNLGLGTGVYSSSLGNTLNFKSIVSGVGINIISDANTITISSIGGPQGLSGIQGLIGPQGLSGIQGIQGVQGLSGIQGIPGISGVQGAIGPQGLSGIQGIAGTSGVPGTIQSFLSPLFLNGLTVSGSFASATQSGFLSSTDWNTFNNKQTALGFSPLNSVLSGSLTASASGSYNLGTQSSPLATGFFNTISGPAGIKAWVTFSGITTGFINAAYNINSVTRISAGKYSIGFSKPFANTNFGINCGPNGANISSLQISTIAATGIGITTVSGTLATDSSYCSLSFFSL